MRLLNTSPLAEACVQAAAPYADFKAIGGLISAFLEAQRRRALDALPALTGAQLGEDEAAWCAWFTEHAQRLGPQVEPRGWFG